MPSPTPPDFEAEAREAEQRSVVHGPGAFVALARRMDQSGFERGRRAGLEEAAGVVGPMCEEPQWCDDPAHKALDDAYIRIRALAEGEG